MRKKSRAVKTNANILKIVILVGIIFTLVVTNVLFTMVTGTHFRSGKNVFQYMNDTYVEEKVIANRGYIYDRNKEVIAQDVESYDLFAYIDENRINATNEPVYVVDFNVTCEKLAPILGVSADKLLPYLENAKQAGSTQTEFGVYGKGLSAQQKEDVIALDLPGLDFTKSTSRKYAASNFASQLIGYAQYNYDKDRISGVTGLEATFDEVLSGEDGSVVYQASIDGTPLPKTTTYTKIPKNGQDVYLTLDKNVQLSLEKTLSDTLEHNGATKAWGIVMEVKTGKVLAQAGYPSFDLNTRENITEYTNLPSDFAFEPGSVIKPFVVAGAIEEGVYNGDATFKSGSIHLGVDENGRIIEVSKDDARRIATISDAMGKEYGVISYNEGLIRSTNTAMINLLLNYYSPAKNIEYLKKFGFFESVDIYGLNDVAGFLNQNDALSPYMLSFGQGSTFTAYQLIQAASALFGDGKMVKPYIIDKIVDSNTGKITYQGETEKSEQIISQDTANQMQELLKRVVSESYGTAKHYAMDDITLMAKTGTGQIAMENGKGYSSTNYTSSILAAAPAENPEIVIYYAFQGTDYLNYDPSYFQETVREALLAINGYSSNNSEVQEGQLANYSEYTMPSLVNHTVDYANSKITPLTKNIYIIGDGKSIISQYPNSNEITLSNQKVFLLTDGTNITMPNMTGWSRKDVKLFAKFTGIDITINGSGLVKTQSVAEKTTLQKDTKIEVTLE